MILRLAVRSLATRPLRTAVLAIGFGLGIAVMAELLGVGQVILEQAHSPALAGGGDVVVTGALGPVDNARFILADVLGSPQFRPQIAAASPTRRATVYIVGSTVGPIAVRGGVPSRERAIGDPETAEQAAWSDAAGDAAWTDPRQSDLLRAMDRFHPAPRGTAGGRPNSWAEWLYFNGRSADGSLRFYVTFLAGPANAAGERRAFVRLQCYRNGATASYSSSATTADGDLVDRAPDIDVGGNRVRLLDDGRYRIEVMMPGVSTDLTLTPAAGRSMPPAVIHGARGWLSGYVVPVLSGRFSGTIRTGAETITVDGASGYHDHNWGYWEGVRWQWGQVASGELSIVYGRVFPPAEAADAARVPGFMGVIGPDGPLAFSTNVSISEEDAGGRPRRITIESRDREVALTLQIEVSDVVETAMDMTRERSGSMVFLQLGGDYHVTGRAAGREIDFRSRGSAETFRPDSQSAIPQP